MEKNIPLHQPVFPELVIKKSLPTLFLRGAWTWVMAALLLIIFDQIFISAPQANLTLATLPNQNLFTAGAVVRILLFFVYGAVMLYVVLAWASEYYIIKDDSISICSGVLSTTQTNYEMQEIEDTKIQQGWFDRLFNVGDVIFISPTFNSYRSDGRNRCDP
jgi:uncharacterized membrane protein YdbT with pleckstrin-like domain